MGLGLYLEAISVLSRTILLSFRRLLLFKHIDTRRQNPNATNITVPIITIQMIRLAEKKLLAPSDDSGVPGHNGWPPPACLVGGPTVTGATANGEGAKAGADGIIVVLKGFPSFLHI